MTREGAAELSAIADELARFSLADRRNPHRPHEIRSELAARLRQAIARETIRTSPSASRPMPRPRI